MYENIKGFLKEKEFNDELKHELFLNYIKIREYGLSKNERETDDNIEMTNENVSENSNLFLLFNRKNEIEMQKECNGLIMEKDTKNVICACQNDFEETIPEESELVGAEYCEDGTVLRLYNYKDKWIVASRKCIDASYSYWSSEKSFNDMFWELFSNVELNVLNKNNTYLFILLHTDNNFVVKHFQNRLVYTGSINNKTCEYSDEHYFDNIETITRPEQIDIQHYIQNNMIDSIDIQEEFQNYFNPMKRGVILKFKKENQIKLFKIDFSQFNFIKYIRGNEPRIRNRYLQLLSDPDKLHILINHYPEHSFLFDMIYHSIIKMCNTIYKIYRETHVKHFYRIEDNHVFFQTIRQLHAQFKITNQFITISDVFIKVKSLHPHVLKKMLNWVN